jgi:pyruvate, water dikinase
MPQDRTLILDFSQIGMADVARVGGKNASLGEMFNSLGPRGVGVVDGFATTADAYWLFLDQHGLRERLTSILGSIDGEETSLAEAGQAARRAVLDTPLPQTLSEAIRDAYRRLSQRTRHDPDVAVRSSATAEDLPEASFAGAGESFLNVRGEDALLRAVHHCCASLFTDRAIDYRARLGYAHMQVALSVGVMPMVRSDRASSGVIFTLDPETGFRQAVVVTGAWGLGEAVVQGIVTPDEWTVFKPTLGADRTPIVGRRLGTKEVRIVYGDESRATRSRPTPEKERARFCLGDDEVLQLARWAIVLEDHYSGLAGHPQPMDIEWAKDGVSGKLYIVQARPETVHSGKSPSVVTSVCRLETQNPGPPLVRGQAVGELAAGGRVRKVLDTRELGSVENGEILVARSTDPDWEPVMRRVAAIVTDQGGRTAHAAIVSREFGLPCIVGTGDATSVLSTGQEVTVSCCEGPEGRVYSGRIPFRTEPVDTSGLAETRTRIMLIVGDPGQAFSFSSLPNAGVGLARSEFIINNHIGIHPMALIRYPDLADAAAVGAIRRRIGDQDPREYFVGRFAEGIGKIAAAFYPKPVIVRTSDFKTNEYAALLGGREFEPVEDNPMLGFRGASRYYDPRYREGFRLECAALLRVRRDMGLGNVRVMIPFCRTVDEGRRVVEEMADNGLVQGENGLEIYAMCEIPSNVVLAEEFLKVFDGLSIGSNDLTQLTLGIDRDSGTIAHLFDERNEAVVDMIRQAIRAARRSGKPIGICGQAPSDYPEFARILVEEGIDSISLNPDAVVKTARIVAEAEKQLARTAPSR